MGKLILFLAGLVAGAAVAHVLSRTPTGARVARAVDAATNEFVAALSDSYRARLEETR